MIKSPVQHRRHAGVVCHEDYPAELEALDYSVQIRSGGGKARSSGPVCSPSPAEEIESHDLMPLDSVTTRSYRRRLSGKPWHSTIAGPRPG